MRNYPDGHRKIPGKILRREKKRLGTGLEGDNSKERCYRKNPALAYTTSCPEPPKLGDQAQKVRGVYSRGGRGSGVQLCLEIFELLGEGT